MLSVRGVNPDVCSIQATQKEIQWHGIEETSSPPTPCKKSKAFSQSRSLSSKVIYCLLHWKLIHYKIHSVPSPLSFPSTLVHPVVCNSSENFRGILKWLQMCKDARYRPLHQEDDITLHASFRSSSFSPELGDTIVPDSLCACWEWWDYNSSWQCSVPRKLTALFNLEFPLPLWSHLILNLFYGFLTLLTYFCPWQSFTHTSLYQNTGEAY